MRWSSKFLILLILSSCNRNPPEQSVQVYSAFQESGDEKGAQIDKWWEGFNDPVLTALVEQALLENIDLKIAGEKVAQARALASVADAELLPEIDLNGQAQRAQTSKNTAGFPGMSFNLFQIGFDALWEIDLFGSGRAQSRAAHQQFEAIKLQQSDVSLIIISEITKTYMELRAAQLKSRYLAQALSLQKAIIDHALDRWSAGLTPQQDLEAEFILFTEIAASSIRLENERKIARYRLSLLLGKRPVDLPPFELVPMPQADQKLHFGVPSDLLKRRADLRAAERILASKTSLVASQIADFFPKFSLLGGIGLASKSVNNFAEAKSVTWQGGSAFNWPILNFGRLKNRLQFAKSSEREALLAYEGAILSALSEAESSLASYFTSREHTLLTQEKAGSKARELGLINALFDAGLERQSEAFAKKIESLLLEQEIVDAQLAENKSLISLYKTLGGGVGL